MQVNALHHRRRRDTPSDDEDAGSSYWGPVDMNTEDGASLNDPCKASK